MVPKIGTRNLRLLRIHHQSAFIVGVASYMHPPLTRCTCYGFGWVESQRRQLVVLITILYILPKAITIIGVYPLAGVALQ